MYAIIDFQQHRRFEELRERLTAADGRRLDRPLAYWALGSDRGLPRAFMGRATRDIVETPFGQLCGTPGIGRKKMGTLLELLERALAHAHGNDHGHHVPTSPNGHARTEGRHTLLGAVTQDGQEGRDGQQERFDPRAVSEPLWERWRETVKLHGLEQEPLARFAPSLQDLPRVIWQTPLAEYSGSTLEQLRGRKKHGEKRVRAVVEVFAAVQSLLGDRPAGHLAVRIVPRMVTAIETWLNDARKAASFPPAAEVRRSFVEPLLAQLRCDGGELIARLVAGRVNVSDEFPTVRAAAQTLGLTRARVYQLLAEATTILALRWPDARTALQPLAAKAAAQRSTSRGAKGFLDAAGLLFPLENRRTQQSWLVPSS
jgi:hypothetical protein